MNQSYCLFISSLAWIAVDVKLNCSSEHRVLYAVTTAHGDEEAAGQLAPLPSQLLQGIRPSPPLTLLPFLQTHLLFHLKFYLAC